jgi:opacity protein-like surface antigen
VLCALGSLTFGSSTVRAEVYAGGQLGFTIPEAFSNVVNDGGGFRFSNLDLNNAIAYGAKAGFYSEQYKWLGVETDLYTATPHLEGQTATRTDGGSTSVSVPGALTRVTTWAFSVMARHPGEKFQPYAGIGIGLNFAKASGAFSRDTDTSPGVHLVGGLRMFVNKEVALFTEYKYDRATFRFRDLDNGPGGGTGFVGDYAGHTLMAGISFHLF